MTNPSPARPPLVLDEVVAASEEAGDYSLPRLKPDDFSGVY